MKTEEVIKTKTKNVRPGYMKSMFITFQVTTILFMIFFTQSLFSQEIQVNEFKPLPLDISAREKVVKDPNGDVCSIIKVRIGLQDIKFSGDLGINKMEYHDGEYWLWVPPGTHKLTVEASSYQKTDFELPIYTEEYNVYIVFLSITTPEKKEYLPARLASFTTKPWHAQVFINDIYYGKTPIQADIPFDTFKYSIRKKKFLSVEGTDSIKKEPLFYSHWLEIDPDARRFFILASTGYGFNQYGFFGGLSLGAMGREGYYFTFMVRNPNSTLEHFKMNSLLFISGFNRRLVKYLYVNIGIGTTAANPPETFILNGSIIFRTNSRILFSVGVTSIFINRWDNGSYPKDETDLNIGIGYNF